MIKGIRESVFAKLLVVYLIICTMMIAGLVAKDLVLNKQLFTRIYEEKLVLGSRIETSIDAMLESLEMSIQTISRDKFITNVNVADKYSDEICERLKEYKSSNYQIQEIYYITDSNKCFTSGKDDITSIDKSSEWYEMAMKDRGRIVYSVDRTREKSPTLIAKTVNKDGVAIGVIGILVKKDLIQSFVNQGRFGTTGGSMVINELGDIIATSGEAPDLIRSVRDIDMGEDAPVIDSVSVEGRDYIIAVQINKRTSWYIIGHVNEVEIRTQLSRQIKYNISILLTLMTLGSIILFISIKIILSPLKSLRLTIEEIKRTGNLAIKAPVYSEDEIGLLSQGFNNMIEDINYLVESIGMASNEIDNRAKEFVAITQNNLALAEESNGVLTSFMSNITQKKQDTDAINGQVIGLNEHLDSFAERINNIFLSITSNRELNSVGVSNLVNIENLVENNSRNIDNISFNLARLRDSSNSVNEIIDSIDDISKEINMLSLNARIEAARAEGENRGFIVVAEEVKELADKTKSFSEQARNKIDRMLEDLANTLETIDSTRVQADNMANNVQGSVQSFRGISSNSDSLKLQADEIRMHISGLTDIRRVLLENMKQLVSFFDTSVGMIQSIEGNIEEQSSATSIIAEESIDLRGYSEGLRNKLHSFSIDAK